MEFPAILIGLEQTTTALTYLENISNRNGNIVCMWQFLVTTENDSF